MTRSLTVELLADLSKFSPALGRAVGSLVQFGEKAQSVGTAISLSLSAPLGAFAAKAVEAYGEMDSLTRGLATLEKNAGSLQARLSELNQVAKLPGLGYKEAIQFDVALRSAGFSAELSKRSMLAFGNALGTIGKGKNELKGVSVQLQQLATKTGGYGADLRIIKEYAPQVGSALGAAFGTVDTEAISKAGYTGKQVVEKIVTELEKLSKATGGIRNAFENFGDSAFRSLAKVGEIISNGLGLEGFINGIGDKIASLVDRFANLSPPLQRVIVGFGLAAVALPPLLAGLGLLASTVLPAIGVGFTLITGPIGVAVAAIAAAATLIVMHWDKVKSFLVDTHIWDTLKSVVSSGLGFITSIFGAFANLFQGDWSNLWVHAQNITKYAWNGFVSTATTGILAMGGVIAKGLAAIGLDKWANSVKTRMDEVFRTSQSRQFVINSPKVSGSLFSGFNFGGDKAGKTNGSGGGKTGKGTNQKDPETLLELLQRKLRETEAKIQDFAIRGLKVPADVMASYYGYTDAVKHAADALDALKRVDIDKVKPIASNNVLGSVKEQLDEASRHLKFNTALRGGGELQEPKLPGLDKYMKSFEKSLKPVKKAMVDLNKGLSEGLEKASITALKGMGAVIGGLAAGTAGLSDIPAMLLGVLGSLLTELGEMAIEVGFGVLAIQTALKTLNPFVAIAAGVALLALGTYVSAKSQKMGTPRALASGGLLSGPTNVIAGEYPGASSNPEVYAPLDKLKGHIADAVGGRGGGGTLTARVSGSDLIFIINRAREQSRGNGRG